MEKQQQQAGGEALRKSASTGSKAKRALVPDGRPPLSRVKSLHSLGAKSAAGGWRESSGGHDEGRNSFLDLPPRPAAAPLVYKPPPQGMQPAMRPNAFLPASPSPAQLDAWHNAALDAPPTPPNASGSAMMPPMRPHANSFSKAAVALPPLPNELSQDLSSSLPRSQKSPALPDPANFPDPYPFRSPHPYISSADSSSASTRSSGFTNGSIGSSRSSNPVSDEAVHARVQSSEADEVELTHIISSETVVDFRQRESNGSSLSSNSHRLRAAADRLRRIDHTRIRPESDDHEPAYSREQDPQSDSPGRLKGQASYDMSWQSSGAQSEDIGLTSEDEMDYGDQMEDGEEDTELDGEERTTAAVIAEEGRGLICCAEGGSVSQLIVHPGTTHLLAGGTSAPNAMPTFLASVLPQIGSTLLALDISANFLNSLPPALASCICLEELNIASNPLRVLPLFLAHLTSLRVLIADSTGLTTLPQPLQELTKLHTLSIRRNKMHVLPPWLCQLPQLESLLVDGNPFQGPWKALVEPLLAKTPMTPIYPPSTPMFPLPSASATSTASTDTEQTDAEEETDQEDVQVNGDGIVTLTLDEEHTITPATTRSLGRSVTSPIPHSASTPPPRPLSRNRSTPSRSFHDRSRSGSRNGPPTPVDHPLEAQKIGEDEGYFTNHSHNMRRMRSADELRQALRRPATTITPSGASPSGSPTFRRPMTSSGQSPARPSLTHYATSASSSNLLLNNAGDYEMSDHRRFASLGVASRGPSRAGARPGIPAAIWDEHSIDEESDADGEGSPRAPSSPARSNTSYTADRHTHHEGSYSRDSNATIKPTAVDKVKSKKWGFLKKMSMGRMKSSDLPQVPPTPPSRAVTLHGRPSITPSGLGPGRSGASLSAPAVPRIAALPELDLNLGGLDAAQERATTPVAIVAPSQMSSTTVTPFAPSPVDTLQIPARSPSTGLLTPTSPTPRSAKRRSFLPIGEGSPLLNIPIPNPAPFLPGITVSNSEEKDLDEANTPLTATSTLVDPPPQEVQELNAQEQERMLEANARALRSLMAYLRDMHDLTVSTQGGAQGDRPRRPTVSEVGRSQSETSVLVGDMSPVPTATNASHLRSPDTLTGARNASSNVANSVATTDSGNSGSEERKYKEDKGKRKMIIREIVETERTYVKNLHDLVEIYVKPASAPVSSLSTVGSSSAKETIVPAAERKIVFGGLEALYSFHKESFLPALEHAAAPLLSVNGPAQDDETDGGLSLSVAMAVGNSFMSHAAFMRMYSTYINNFDNAVQRIKHWMTDRPAPPTGPMSSPSSSSAQLAGMAMAMSAISTPGIIPDGPSQIRTQALSTGQRKRIRSYLKRCRMNPRHTQLNLEGYLLLPVQRIPRYRLLLEELVTSTPPASDAYDAPLEAALTEISSLANNMNEGKREAESRRKLVHWQSRIRGKFPSPLVQPHRRLIMDGRLLLTRVVRKQVMSFEVLDSQGDTTSVQVDCLSPEPTPRPLVGILCNDLLVLCRDPSEGADPMSPVDLWAVLRMQTLPQPASIVHGNALRIVDNKAILYFEAPTTSDALTWFRAINLHIPSSKA